MSLHYNYNKNKNGFVFCFSSAINFFSDLGPYNLNTSLLPPSPEEVWGWWDGPQNLSQWPGRGGEAWEFLQNRKHTWTIKFLHKRMQAGRGGGRWPQIRQRLGSQQDAQGELAWTQWVSLGLYPHCIRILVYKKPAKKQSKQQQQRKTWKLQ